MPYKASKLPAMDTDDGQALAGFLEEELQRIESAQIDDVVAIELRPSYKAPVRPRSGMIVYADGVVWNPGAGEGVYSFTLAGAWVKL